MTGRRLELAIGIVLGLIAGVAIAYVLVTVVGSGRDASEVSTGAQPPGGAETRPPPADRGAP